jgi:hypothetical protein
MASQSYREVHLAARPKGAPTLQEFTLVERLARAPEAGEVRVRNLWLSVDPYMRGRMSERMSYAAAYGLGEPLLGGAVGVVEESAAEGLAAGDLVESMQGWREGFTAPAAAVEKLPAFEGTPPQAYLGVMGMPGLSAYVGLLHLGAPQAGERVFVSGAAGAVGSLVCQIAKLKGCYVVGSAGSAEKCAWLEELGVDRAINYRAEANLGKALHGAMPEGLDLYFDNVGGAHLEAALDAARPFARFVECGMIAGYNDSAQYAAPRNLIQIIAKSLTLKGFIVLHHGHARDAFRRDMAQWIAEGRVRWSETVREGLEAAPQAFIDLFSGANTGKMLVQLPAAPNNP